MQILADACLALLAAIGIWTLARMALDRMLDGGEEREVLTLVRAWGDGNGVEQAASDLLRFRRGGKVFLVDCGLNERGRAQLEALAERERSICLCHPDDLENLVKEADVWMNRGNKTK